MTNYLTKKSDGQYFHYRAWVDSTGVSMVEGERYVSLSEYFEQCGTIDKAILRQQELVQQKRDEGYQDQEFEESLENTLGVYDKAKWHFSGNFPEGLDDFQAYVHTGMFLGWLVDAGLVSEAFQEENAVEIQLFKNRQLTGAQLYEKACDGVLLLEDLSKIGNLFSLHYFEFSSGLYPTDYTMTLCRDLPSIFHVADTWENYEKIKRVLDRRFNDIMDIWTKLHSDNKK